VSFLKSPYTEFDCDMKLLS